MTFHRYTVCLVLLILGACQSDTEQDVATLVVTDARVWTGDPDRPWAEAVASRGDTIIAVGSKSDIAPVIGEDTEIISVAGSMLVPGMIDTHVHFITGGSGLAAVQLRDAATPEEFVARIGEYAKTLKPG